MLGQRGGACANSQCACSRIQASAPSNPTSCAQVPFLKLKSARLSLCTECVLQYELYFELKMKRFLVSSSSKGVSSKSETCSGENVQKKTRVLQKYRPDYTKEFPCLKQSEKSVHHVFCTTCSRDFVVSHGGRDDCRRHVNGQLHMNNEKCRQSTSKFSMKTFVTSGNDENSVSNAELLFTSFLIEHNLPIGCSDHAGPLFRKMFPDSAIAKKYGCARTKTSAIVRGLAAATQNEIASVIKNNPFALATDGSTDISDIKLYPIVVSYFSVEVGKITTMLLSVKESTVNTGEGIFNLLDSELREKNIPWKNCIAFSCDNASTMTGCIKGVVSFIKKEQPLLHVQGCACHLIHIAAQKGVNSFQNFDTEKFVIDIYYYLQKSSKRQAAFKLCQNLYGDKPHKILKYVSTRWLSLLIAVDRIIEQWEPLKVLFGETSKNEKNAQFQRITFCFQEPVTKLYLLFLSSLLPVFVSVNVFLQQEQPVIHKLHRKLKDLFMDLVVRFVKPTAIPSGCSLSSLNFEKLKNQKDSQDLVIGAKTRSYIKEACIEDNVLAKFYLDVRQCYINSCKYVKEKIATDDEFLKHAEVAEVTARKSQTFSSVQYMLTQFPNVLSSEESESIELEFSKYQFDDFDACEDDRIDKFWHNISEIRDVSGVKKYSALAKLMLTILLVPQSNAPTERVFSIIKKNKTDFRPNMNTDTLSSLMIEKMKQQSAGERCYDRKFSEAQLKAAKKSTWAHLTSVVKNDTGRETALEECAEEEGL